MTIEVKDVRAERPVGDHKETYPVGAFVLVRSTRRRVTVIGHTDTRIIALDGETKCEIEPSDDLIVLGRSTEEYVNRIVTDVTRVASENSRTRDALPALAHLTDESPDGRNQPLYVRVTTVGHYILAPRVQFGSSDELRRYLRDGYVDSHGSFDSSYFIHVQSNGEGELGTVATHSVTMELLDDPTEFTQPTQVADVAIGTDVPL